MGLGYEWHQGLTAAGVSLLCLLCEKQKSSGCKGTGGDSVVKMRQVILHFTNLGVVPEWPAHWLNAFTVPNTGPSVYFLIGVEIRKEHLWWHLNLFSSLSATCAHLFLNKVVFFYILFIVKLSWTSEHLQIVREGWMSVSFYSKFPALEGAAGGLARGAWVGQLVKEVASRSSAYPVNR